MSSQDEWLATAAPFWVIGVPVTRSGRRRMTKANLQTDWVT